MKRILACVLTLALALGMTPMVFGADNPGATAEIKKSGTTITVTVKLPAVTKLTACIVSVEFDPIVVSIPLQTSGYAATYVPTDETDAIPYFIGEHQGGFAESRDDLVKDAFMSSGGVTKTEATPFAVFTFTVVDNEALTTDFKVTLEQFYADGITIANGEGMTILNQSVDLTVDTSSDGETEPSDEAAELAQKIKDLLTQVGMGAILEDPTISGLIDQFADLFGGGNTADDFLAILDSIIGGDSGNFNFDEIIQFFTNIYEQIAALIGGGDDTTKATTTTTTSDDDYSTEESTDDADNGEHSAGDAGIALAVTICLAAAAAFVISKKKED